MLLFGVAFCCLVVFFYGALTFPYAPYKPCAGGPYCDKTGQHRSDDTYRRWKSWEQLLFICLPLGMVAGIGLERLRKQA